MAKDHFLWNYLYFMYGLLRKDHTDCNGVESYVRAMLEREDLAWFPVLQAKVLGKNNIGVKERIFDQLAAMNSKINGCFNLM